jgi:hypothetical protein
MKPALTILIVAACAAPQTRVSSVGLTVSSLDGARPLFVDALSFAPGEMRTLCDDSFATLVALPGACATRLSLAGGGERELRTH